MRDETTVVRMLHAGGPPSRLLAGPSRPIFTCRFAVLEYIDADMAASKPIPIRFDEDFVDRLDAAADTIGSNRAAVIRFCVLTFVEYLERQQRELKRAAAHSLLSDLSVLTGFTRRSAPVGRARKGRRGGN
jgi:hypothetical protein